MELLLHSDDLISSLYLKFKGLTKQEVLPPFLVQQVQHLIYGVITFTATNNNLNMNPTLNRTTSRDNNQHISVPRLPSSSCGSPSLSKILQYSSYECLIKLIHHCSPQVKYGPTAHIQNVTWVNFFVICGYPH